MALESYLYPARIPTRSDVFEMIVGALRAVDLGDLDYDECESLTDGLIQVFDALGNGSMCADQVIMCDAEKAYMDAFEEAYGQETECCSWPDGLNYVQGGLFNVKLARRLGNILGKVCRQEAEALYRMAGGQ